LLRLLPFTPDNLLAQVLVATTYPLEIVQLHQWLAKNKEIAKDQKKLTEQVTSKDGTRAFRRWLPCLTS
jgi:hypothetical protein